MTSKNNPLSPESMTELANQWVSLWTESSKTITDYWQNTLPEFTNQDVPSIEQWHKMVQEMSELSVNSEALGEAQLSLWQDTIRLWTSISNPESNEAAIAPAKDDRRFRSERWNDGSMFDFIKQSYLLASRYVNNVTIAVDGMDDKKAEQLVFHTRQFMDAVSPSNFAMTNPDVINAAIESKGESLLNGFNNMVEDFKKGDGQLRISMTDADAFELGKNIATTPGKVVFENDLMQLIQYESTTEKAFKRPLLIMPPWINKYYILDLQPENSLIKWLVSQGHSVFVISWVNPDASLADKGMDNYLLEGPVAALDAIEQATGENSVNVVGYCLGGTLLSALLAYNTAIGDERIKSATFLTSMIEFSEPGELGVYIDEQQLDDLDKKMDEQGYLDGADMAQSFNMLRSNDLIWSFVVNNYLMGRSPKAFDLLYWNSDSTRMPARMHKEYLRNMYLNNCFKDAGGVTLNDVEIDVSSIETPTYFLSTAEDHIAPWKSTYMGAALMSGSVKFVLGGSGHIAGVVNPEDSGKYGYWTRSGKLAETADQWFESAKKNEGSWWSDWARWIKRHGGAGVEARTPGDRELDVIEDAPGRYASLRLDKPAR